ncbi:MAG TPA: hypothetical protein P5555_05220 [Candidatus Paceibacterota bacterium]|nr:hypothetical protein [Verrucomicrobiota bacterium]HRZ44573.1 hypothetical protein [Candidatus Paceibacterota bacterium]HRZ93646.1 hypothetical protein [Candidatus Paceibacterota bacterium]
MAFHPFTTLCLSGFCAWIASIAILSAGQPSDAVPEINAGPLWDRSPLTLQSGYRDEMLGPLFGRQQSETQEQFEFHPLFSSIRDPEAGTSGFDLLYPLVTRRRVGEEYRIQLLQLVSFSGGANQAGQQTRRAAFFPVYFQQWSEDPARNSFALAPFYGHIQNRFNRDDVRFVLLPLYVSTRKRGVVTDNYLFPFFHRRHGPGLEGWQLWPLAGHERQDPITTTNGFEEAELRPGHERRFVLWPLYLDQTTGIGTDASSESRALLPLFFRQHSAERDFRSWAWPFFNYTDDRARHYREWSMPWPVFHVARGEGKHGVRLWPLFQHFERTNRHSDFLLWPLYHHQRQTAETLDRQRTRILFYLYSDLTETDTRTQTSRQRTDLWPLFTARRDREGRQRFQLFAPLEPIFPQTPGIERNYSPLWSVWRSESNPLTGQSRRSLLWNLYRQSDSPACRQWSFLFGAFQFERDEAGRRGRILFIPVGARPAAPAPPAPIPSPNPLLAD